MQTETSDAKKIKNDLRKLALQIVQAESRLVALRNKRDSLIYLGHHEFDIPFAELGNQAGIRREAAYYAARRAENRNGSKK